jgi:predicted small metal-binding protein
MKTMTCRQLGGPCEYEHHGDNANDVIKAQDAHLRAAVAAGDSTHQPALDEMKGRWKHPVSGMGWYRAAKRDFAALADE